MLFFVDLLDYYYYYYYYKCQDYSDTIAKMLQGHCTKRCQNLQQIEIAIMNYRSLDCWTGCAAPVLGLPSSTDKQSGS